MRRAVLGALVLLIVLLAAAAAGTAWVMYTEPGLRWSLARLSAAVPGKLEIADPRGTWHAGWSAARLDYDGPQLSAHATGVALSLSPSSVLTLAPRVDSLAADRLVVRLEEGSAEPAGPPQSLGLPARIDVVSARIGELAIERGSEREVLRDVRLSYAGGPDEHLLRELHAEHRLATVDASGRLGAQRPFPLSAHVTAALHAPLAATVTAAVEGSLADLRVAGTVDDGSAQASVRAALAPFDPLPLRRAHIEAQGVDLHRYLDALPPTRIAAAVTLDAKNGRWSGPVRLKNALHGPWDRQRLPVESLSAELTLATSPLSARLEGLRADLGAAGVVHGSATLAPDEAKLALETRSLDLRGLYTKLRKTALKGQANLALAETEQTASGVLAQDDIELAFEAQRNGEEVQLRRFVARSRGGELRGEAELSLAGKRPYMANAQLAHFDPAAWGDFPSGDLNGRVQVAGALDTEAIRVRYALDDSRLRGERLEGAGRFTYAGERIAQADLRLALGGNRMRAQGDFGAPGDELSLTIDAPRLSALDPRVSGAVRGTAELSGTWRAPQGKVDLRGRGLAYGKEARAATLRLRGRLTSLDERAFELEAEGRGLKLPSWRGSRVSLTARGTPEAHTVHAEASGSGFDLALDARGGWRDRRWTGVVSRLENRGDLPFRLEAPVEVAAGPESVRIGPLRASVLEGKLDIARVDYAHGAIRSSGAFSSLPVRPLLALAGLPTGPRDTLRLAGRWSFDAEPQLRAEFSVRRESGDLTLGKDRPLALGLEALRIEGRLVNDRLHASAVLRSALASASGEGSVGAVQSAEGAITISGASPIAFALTADVARLASFAGLFETTTAYFDGRLHAELVGRGTLAHPVVTGTVNGDGIALALPPEGIELTRGTLAARILEDRIVLERFMMHGGEGTLTAEGTLSLVTGQRASVDWRADRLTILGRPDRRLVVSGRGNAALENGKLALTGKLRANEGLVQIGTTDLPTLGSDVVVAGRPRTEPQPARLKNARLELALDLGTELHVLGQGLDAWLEGDVLLRTGPGGELVAEGTVRTQRGRYTAFGQRLQIDRGRLLFDGPVDNPGLDILALRKNQAVQAGVAVTGTVQSPVVRIVSDPPVPEGEALSWLVLGRAPADASRADLAMLPLAAAALFGQGKAGGDSFAARLGLDTLSFKGSTTLANNVVAVGKRFSRNLYVVYEQSLGGLANVLKVELNLTRRLLLRAEAGEVSAAGLVFRWAFD